MYNIYKPSLTTASSQSQRLTDTNKELPLLQNCSLETVHHLVKVVQLCAARRPHAAAGDPGEVIPGGHTAALRVGRLEATVLH